MSAAYSSAEFFELTVAMPPNQATIYLCFWQAEVEKTEDEVAKNQVGPELFCTGLFIKFKHK